MEFKIEPQNKPLNSEIFHKETGCFLFMRDGSLYVEGCNSQEEANALILAHNPPAPKESSIEQKLASVGLNIDDLKSALGL